MHSGLQRWRLVSKPVQLCLKMNSRNFNNQSSLEVEFPAGKAYLASSIGNLAIKNGLYKCPFGGAPAGCGRVSKAPRLVDHVARHIVLETIRGKYHLLHPNTCGFCGDDGCHTTAKAKQRKKNAPLCNRIQVCL